jgi:hypothetical protein
MYYLTVAPTVSFWDCGEFIATSYIMGVPHPPGNPLYVIIGRFFSILPIAGEVALRVNLISVVSSAASVFVAFWLILRLTLNGKDQIPSGPARIGLGIGAFAGALVMGLSYTFWSNAVEAEVYGPSMLIMLITAYVALLWARDTAKPGNDRRLILIAYLLWLSLGIHMTTFILSIPIVLYMAYIDYTKDDFERWPVWILLSLFVLYAMPLQTQFLDLFGVDISAFELESFFIIMCLALASSLAMYFLGRAKNSAAAKIWALTITVFAAGAVGYSTQAYIPIRAAQKPAINENDPSDWPRFKAFLERKQYGQESMVTRMFTRRGSWQSQFVSNPDFGLLRLLSEQYSSPDARLTIARNNPGGGGVDFGLSLSIVYLLFFGLAGIMEAFRRSHEDGAFIILTMVLCTVGLVFYLNFSDGSYNRTIAPIAEVRDRDYFYTPGFMFYGILIGVGLAALMEWAGGLVSIGASRLRKFSRPIFALVIAVAVFLPIHTAAAHYYRVDRSGNYIPWDYAYNILESCDQNAVLFTNGDNDTFPLWFIQEVAGVRTDVRVANLSLLNTPWYIHQLKDQMGVPITLTRAQIDNLMPMRVQGYDRIWRVQDEMVKHIITNSQRNGWNPPVYFAMTVAADNRLGLEDYLILEGMVHRIVETTAKDRVNTGVGWKIFGNPAHFRGVADPNVYKDENDYRLIANYVSAMFQMVDAYEKQGSSDSALVIAEKAVALRPALSMWQAYAYLVKLYAYNGKLDGVDTIVAELTPETGEKVLLAVGQDLIMNKHFQEASALLRKALDRNPSSFPALNNLVVIYYQRGDSALAEATIGKFRTQNVGDPELMRSVDEMLQRLKPSQTAISETP